MKSKYFLHVFISGKNISYGQSPPLPDAIGCFEIRSWAMTPEGFETNSASSNPYGFYCKFTFAKGNRFYIVENHGQCQEPNGDIIWRNEDGAQGDDKL